MPGKSIEQFLHALVLSGHEFLGELEELVRDLGGLGQRVDQGQLWHFGQLGSHLCDTLGPRTDDLQRRFLRLLDGFKYLILNARLVRAGVTFLGVLCFFSDHDALLGSHVSAVSPAHLYSTETFAWHVKQILCLLIGTSIPRRWITPLP